MKTLCVNSHIYLLELKTRLISAEERVIMADEAKDVYVKLGMRG